MTGGAGIRSTGKEHARLAGVVARSTHGRRPDLYALHGLVVASEIALDTFRFPERGADVPCVDVEMVRGAERAVSEEVPAGSLVSFVDGGPYPGEGRRLVTICETANGYRIRYHGLADIEVDRSISRCVIAADPSAAPDVVSTIAGAGVGAFVVAMRHSAVLHASAVEIGDSDHVGEGAAVTFAGPSGSGKSTLAALVCAAGATFVSDDTVRVETVDGQVAVYRGTRSVRLRPGASSLAGYFPEALRARVSDGRTAVTLAHTSPPHRSAPSGHAAPDPLGSLPLGAVVVPDWGGGDRGGGDRGGGASGPALTRLSPRDALVALLPCGRLSNVDHDAIARRHFALCAEIARSVPVFRLEPSGDGLPEATFGSELLEALASAVRARA